MVMGKALYGLKSLRAKFHQKFADTLREFGFKPIYADPEVWIRDAGDVYEYVGVYMDDLLVAMKEPEKFFEALQAETHNYKLKGVEEHKYHLGANFFRDSDGTLCCGLQTYIKRLMECYVQMFGEEPKPCKSLLKQNDHSEIDISESCTPDEPAKYLSRIGALQWTISLARMDIAMTVMTLKGFRPAPLKGHLYRAQRVCEYPKKYCHGAICFRTGISNHEPIFGERAPTYDWSDSIYGNPPEEILANSPPPKGKPVRITTFTDANFLHDLTAGRSASGIEHILNQIPIAWFSKRQAQCETAAYGFNFVASCQATEQIIDLCYTLHMFGVPLDGPSWLFGDSKSVLTSATIPHSTLSKRWNTLSYHRVRGTIAAGFIIFEFIDGKQNPADILTKPLGHATTWPFIDTLLFRKGES